MNLIKRKNWIEKNKKNINLKMKSWLDQPSKKNSEFTNRELQNARRRVNKDKNKIKMNEWLDKDGNRARLNSLRNNKYKSVKKPKLIFYNFPDKIKYPPKIIPKKPTPIFDYGEEDDLTLLV